MTFGAGELIGDRYRLEELIGSGGMGEVFRAHDVLLERTVALKLMDVGDPRRRKDVTRSFLREARISAAIAHPNVVQLLDFGTHEGRIPFIVMELLEGESLADVLSRGDALDFSWIVHLMDQVLDGLSAAHDAGVVHRDLKPENIYLARTKSGVAPKILDFGISKLLDKGGAAYVTTTHGQVVGTPAYMSPEQARGIKQLDLRSDIYSIGVVLYELFAGELPFSSENPGDVMVMIVTSDAPALADRVPGFPVSVSDVVARAMHKDPDRRFANAQALKEALHSARTGLPSLPAPTPAAPRPVVRKKPVRSAPDDETYPDLGSGATASLPRRSPISRRTRVLSTALGLAVVGGAIGVAIALLGRSSASTPRYIVVQADAPRSEPEPAGALPSTSAAPSTEAPKGQLVETTAPASEPPTQRDTPAARLADGFRRQKQGVVACVNAHAAEARRTPKLAVRMALAESGQVQEAHVTPDSIAGSELASCIERAVRNMKFPRQPAALAFEVPLTAR